MLNGRADLLVLEDIVGGIENDLAGRSGRRNGNRELLAVAVLIERVSVDHVLAPDEVDFAFFERQNTRLIVRNDLHDDALNGGFLAPVVRIGFKDGVFINHVLLQYIGTRADKGGKTVLGLAVLHDVGRNKSKGTCNRKLREHRVVGFLHLDDEGIGIGRFNAFEKTHHFKPGVTRFVVNQRIKVCLDSIGVKHVAVGEL